MQTLIQSPFKASRRATFLRGPLVASDVLVSRVSSCFVEVLAGLAISFRELSIEADEIRLVSARSTVDS